MVAPPVAQPRTVVAAVAERLQPAVQPTGLQRVYVAGDGRHHWSRDRALTLCGMVTSPADATKPGAVECPVCRDLADQELHRGP